MAAAASAAVSVPLNLSGTINTFTRLKVGSPRTKVNAGRRREALDYAELDVILSGIMQSDWGAHASRVPPSAPRGRPRHTILSKSVGASRMWVELYSVTPQPTRQRRVLRGIQLSRRGLG